LRRGARSPGESKAARAAPKSLAHSGGSSPRAPPPERPNLSRLSRGYRAATTPTRALETTPTTMVLVWAVLLTMQRRASKGFGWCLGRRARPRVRRGSCPCLGGGTGRPKFPRQAPPPYTRKQQRAHRVNYGPLNSLWSQACEAAWAYEFGIKPTATNPRREQK